MTESQATTEQRQPPTPLPSVSPVTWRPVRGCRPAEEQGSNRLDPAERDAYTSGIGATVDLPQIAVMPQGIDSWGQGVRQDGRRSSPSFWFPA